MRILNRLGGIELSSAYACIKAISKKKEDIIDARRAEFVTGRQEARPERREGRRDLRADREVRRLRLQQDPHRPHTPTSPTRPPTSSDTTRRSSWPPCCRARSTTATSATCSSITSPTPASSASTVLPPDVNRGEPDFTVRDGQIVFGLIAIKGLGRGAAEEIVRARQEKGPFRDLFDFCERVDTKIVTKAGHRTADQGRRDGRLRASRSPTGRNCWPPCPGPFRRPRNCRRIAGAGSATSST